MAIGVAFRAFFAALGGGEKAAAIEAALSGEPAQEALPAPKSGGTSKPEQPPKPRRSDAVTLLAALQREARLVDIVKEPLDEYSDSQVGAAARDVLRDTAAVLDRMFALTPIVEEEDNTEIETPAGFDPARYRLTGNVGGSPPFKGKLVHHGWEAARCDLPQWSGSDEAARVIAPVELEL